MGRGSSWRGVLVTLDCGRFGRAFTATVPPESAEVTIAEAARLLVIAAERHPTEPHALLVSPVTR